MKMLSAILLTGMLMLLTTLSFAKPETFLQSIQNKLQQQIKISEGRDFTPLLEDIDGDALWAARVNLDYLRGVVTVFEAANAIPAELPGQPFWESRTFGVALGVVVTLLLNFAVQ